MHSGRSPRALATDKIIQTQSEFASQGVTPEPPPGIFYQLNRMGGGPANAIVRHFVANARIMRNIGNNFSVSCFITCILAFSLYGQSKSNWKKDYYGPVKTVRTETLEFSFANDKQKAGKRELSSIEQFDRLGRLLEEVQFGSDGELLWSEKNVFSNGRLVETSVKHSPDIFLPERRVYKYDDVGNLIEESGYNLSGKLVNQSTYIYDAKNLKVQWTSVSLHPEEHSKPHRWTYAYDEQLRLREEKAFSDEGNGFVPTDSLGGPHKKLLVYRKRDEWEGALFFDTTSAFVSMTLLTYDRRGNEIEDIEYDQNGHVKAKTRYEYKFDKLGNWIEQKTYKWNMDGGRGSYRLEEVNYRRISFYTK